MLEIKRNVSLTEYTTLKIGSTAEFFAVVKSKEDLLSAITWSQENKKEIFILGFGSNLLITKKIKALVLKNEIKGINISKENKNSVFVTAKSGESWTKYVNFSAQNGLYGLENLYLVPGTVGAAPVQNIGAYGVELKDNFFSLVAINLQTGQEKTFKLADCHFAYRESIFKNKLKGKYFIYALTMKLSRKAKFNLDYGDIKVKLTEQGIDKPSLMQVVKTIEKIRNAKLPNPAILPNAGSFFKNSEISLSHFKKLQKDFPDIKSFPSGKKIKIPTAWLIEQVGLKGKRFGSVSMYEKQALILVNHGGATAKQIITHVNRVKLSVAKKFGIKLEEEVNII